MLFRSNWPAAGLVHVFRGGSSGLSGSSSREAWATWGQSRDAQLGFSLAMGDANGDGYADLFTGVPGTDEVVTWYGTSSSTTWSGVGHTYGTGYGDVLAAGDYDLDGLTDLAMGKPDYNSSTGVAGAGVVVVVGTFGGTRSFDQDSSGVSGVAQAYDGFGAALR